MGDTCVNGMSANGIFMRFIEIRFEIMRMFIGEWDIFMQLHGMSLRNRRCNEDLNSGNVVVRIR